MELTSCVYVELWRLRRRLYHMSLSQSSLWQTPRSPE